MDFASDLLAHALEKGQAVVLLDGLDEVSENDEHLSAGSVVGCIKAFAERYRRSRLIVTGSVLSYQEAHWRLPAAIFANVELAPFDEEKIDRFIHAWYTEVGEKWELGPGEAGRLAKKLSQAVRRPELWRLAPKPFLLLTVMALAHIHRGELPEKRALLYFALGGLEAQAERAQAGKGVKS